MTFQLWLAISCGVSAMCIMAIPITLLVCSNHRFRKDLNGQDLVIQTMQSQIEALQKKVVELEKGSEEQKENKDGL